ncbi:MAG TPA: hypothetical protein H9836_20075 [Candidatus Nocardiopsis merdipullorum]|jgi:hypothetical protein|nr:hypothetical protein [Candidatus Nocardiopsis merdipullorum]
MAGERGTPNTELPHHPEEFINADAKKKAQFVTTLRAAGKTTPGLQEDALEAIKRAQLGVATPTIRASPFSASPASSEHHQERGKGPDIER